MSVHHTVSSVADYPTTVTQMINTIQRSTIELNLPKFFIEIFGLALFN